MFGESMQKRRFHEEERMRSGEMELQSSDWSKLGHVGNMNSISTTFMLKTSSGSKRFYDEFASEDQCAENLLMLSILTFFYVKGAGARWTWRGRTIACCPLNLKAKMGISSQVYAYK
ncbi:hypothetical protein PIB30_033038 [Stylosanthes scabra]|uniref:Uncharacterized protein n=1 Tax=Stylosanthes scabra TaxID=79078 RepID=A0ABU6XE81_9FABA|nr:hypothetical protein [Stylosanthes scabra]